MERLRLCPERSRVNRIRVGVTIQNSHFLKLVQEMDRSYVSSLGDEPGRIVGIEVSHQESLMGGRKNGDLRDKKRKEECEGLDLPGNLRRKRRQRRPNGAGIEDRKT